MLIVFPYGFLYFCSINCYVSLFISFFFYLDSLSLFSGSLARGLSILLILWKGQLLVLLIFFYFLIFSTSFFLLTYLRFFLFFFFFEEYLNCYEFSLRIAFAVSHRFCTGILSLSSIFYFPLWFYHRPIDFFVACFLVSM